MYMIIGFLIWSITSIIILGIAISTWRSKEPTGFYTGVKPPEVKDAKRYNHQVAILWLVYAILFELLGVPLLFLEQNSAFFVFVIFGVMAITLLLVIVYHFIIKNNQCSV